MEIQYFIGYHGTDDASARKIIRTNFIVNRMSVGWLGTGIYFFDEDDDMAIYWASRQNKGKIPKVIRGEIEIPKEKVLDMTDGESKVYFHEFRKKLL